jgi:hypothetical protein
MPARKKIVYKTRSKITSPVGTYSSRLRSSSSISSQTRRSGTQAQTPIVGAGNKTKQPHLFVYFFNSKLKKSKKRYITFFSRKLGFTETEKSTTDSHPTSFNKSCDRVFRTTFNELPHNCPKETSTQFPNS